MVVFILAQKAAHVPVVFKNRKEVLGCVHRMHALGFSIADISRHCYYRGWVFDLTTKYVRRRVWEKTMMVKKSML